MRSCKKLLKPGGLLAFWVIYIAPNLSAERYASALGAGPRATSTRQRSYPEMLRSEGFPSVETADVTIEFRETVHGMLVERDRHAIEVRAVSGEKAFADKQSTLARTLNAIDEGLLKRALFLARSPNRTGP